MTDLAKKLSETERDQSFPNVRPRDAATLILVDRSEKAPKVLLGRRHAGHVFMPGKFVFPGGRVEKSDRAMQVASPLHAQTQERLLKAVERPSPPKAAGYGLAAIRETFEETGLLIGAKGARPAHVPDGPWADFTKLGYLPDLSALHFVARAITPPRRPRRFDTRFFSLDASAIAHKVEGITGPDAELVELVWIPIAQAKSLDLPAITGVVLDELEARVAAGFTHDLPVPFYRMIRGKFVRELL